MPPPYTTYAVSRFINREAVLDALRRVAAQVRACCPGVQAVYLFGSFAHGTPTPRSDADILVAVTAEADRQHVSDCCRSVFLAAPVPVDLFVQPQAEIEASCAAGCGLAATALRRAVRLA